MKPLWAPWRMQYIRSAKPDECLFCRKAEEGNERENLVVRRGAYAYVLLNAYPYNNGHMMVAPYEHVADLEALPHHTAAELMKLVQEAVLVLKSEFRAEGVNVGLNLGAAAGAGIADHLHMHVVPRWSGDTNFMPVVADVRVIPQSLEDAHERLSEAFRRLSGE